MISFFIILAYGVLIGTWIASLVIWGLVLYDKFNILNVGTSILITIIVEAIIAFICMLVEVL